MCGVFRNPNMSHDSARVIRWRSQEWVVRGERTRVGAGYCPHVCVILVHVSSGLMYTFEQGNHPWTHKHIVHLATVVHDVQLTPKWDTQSWTWTNAPPDFPADSTKVVFRPDSCLWNVCHACGAPVSVHVTANFCDNTNRCTTTRACMYATTWETLGDLVCDACIDFFAEVLPLFYDINDCTIVCPTGYLILQNHASAAATLVIPCGKPRGKDAVLKL
jgi:hypothetical protein